MQYFNIQVASQLSGVASATIRAWEKRYNAVVPERGDNKHRLYSEKDIEILIKHRGYKFLIWGGTDCNWNYIDRVIKFEIINNLL